MQCEWETAMFKLCSSLCLLSSFRLSQQSFNIQHHWTASYLKVNQSVYEMLARVVLCVYVWAVGMAHGFSRISTTDLTDSGHFNLTSRTCTLSFPLSSLSSLPSASHISGTWPALAGLHLTLVRAHHNQDLHWAATRKNIGYYSEIDMKWFIHYLSIYIH